MTPKEFYEWAVEHGAEDYDIKVDWMDEYGFGYDTPEENQLSIDQSAERITIDV